MRDQQKFMPRHISPSGYILRHVNPILCVCSTCLRNDAGLLQQVCPNPRSTYVMGLVKMDLDELAKATAVVVAHCLGIAEALQNRVGLQARKIRFDDLSNFTEERWGRGMGKGPACTSRRLGHSRCYPVQRPSKYHSKAVMQRDKRNPAAHR